MSISKHQQILKYIEDLEVNTKVSVRQLAKELDVSEGTAYRAIKEAEKNGFVSSIPKVGTIRIAQEEERRIENLTVKEVEHIVEAVILTGHDNLDWIPTKFAIGAMSDKNIQRYIEEKTLLIVGDRPEVQLKALSEGAALLITGGFTPCGEVVELAKMKGLPILVSPYDTFAVTFMINRSIYNRLTEKELILVEDIMVPKVDYLRSDQTVAHWHQLAQKSQHSRFPVVDDNLRVVGIVSAIDVAGMSNETQITQVMTTNVITAEKHTSVTHLSRVMVWEGVEIVPVLEEKKLVGVVSRKDIIESFQVIQKQPHFEETIDNILISGFRLDKEMENIVEISGKITQFMANEFGTASIGNLVTIINTAAYIAIRKNYKLDTITDNITFHQLKPVLVDQEVKVIARIIHMEKKICKVDTELYVNNKIVAKGLISARVEKR